MKDQTQKIWQALNLLEDLIRHGERSEHLPAPLPRVRPGSPPGSSTVRGARASASNVTASGTLAASGSTAACSRPEAAAGDPASRLARLAAIAERVRRCSRCPLAEGRMNAVPGEGVLDPLVMVIGEGPGADEDRRGVPFVGRAGQYLDKWLEAIDVSRTQSAFIGNIVKCRPPGNRDPKPSETDACMPYLREQIELIRPRTILSVGRIASGLLIGTSAGIGSLRGRTYYYDGIPLIPTYHPSGVLRNPEYRRPVWDDLKRLAAILQSPDSE